VPSRPEDPANALRLSTVPSRFPARRLAVVSRGGGGGDGAHLPHTINVPFTNVNRMCTRGAEDPRIRGRLLGPEADQPVAKERHGLDTAVHKGRAQAKDTRMKRTMLLLLPALLSSGCATVKTLEATGGSRSDGTVELSYEYGSLEAPQVQWEQGLVTARERCAAWGYSDAEAFGGEKLDLSAPRKLSLLVLPCNGGLPVHQRR
jgi:YecR-like lipoprotein